ncbi:Hypothetical_protein [Hexamita inflata]|uniref:Hypothetical_protein n=1 Tax=Hexamita inflata TaxID=28002 RepID=A0AA86PG53_9EUKA|nr:Hypothetical protein HINF_LOCUS26001 [Hexamita inflata]
MNTKCQVDEILSRIDSLNGLYMFITLFTCVYEKLLQNIFSDSTRSHIQRIIEFGQLSVCALQFMQGFLAHLSLNRREYKMQDFIKMFVATYIRQQVPLVMTYILLSSTEYRFKYCSNQSLSTHEFLQVPFMFGTGSQCGIFIIRLHIHL